MNYGQFFTMIPEATLVAILIIAFVADFVSAKSAERKWFNPLMCLLLVGQTAVSLLQTEPATAFGGLSTPFL